MNDSHYETQQSKVTRIRNILVTSTRTRTLTRTQKGEQVETDGALVLVTNNLPLCLRQEVLCDLCIKL